MSAPDTPSAATSIAAKTPPDDSAHELDGYDVRLEPAHGFYLGKPGTWRGWSVQWRAKGSRRFERFTLVSEALSWDALALAIRTRGDRL